MKNQNMKSYIISKDREDIEKNEVQVIARLDEKRCLTIKEFQSYCSIGRNNALKLAKQSGAAIYIGRKIVVDRVAFDRWLDKQECHSKEREIMLI